MCFKNNGFDVTDTKLVNKDKCKQFRTNQRNGNENYVLNFYSTGRIAINSKCVEELLESKIPSLENLYKITYQIKEAKFLKSQNTSTATVKESNTKDFNDQDNTSSINLETYKEPSQTPSDTTFKKSKISPPKKTTPEKRNYCKTYKDKPIKTTMYNKIETEQTRLTEEFNQVQVHVQSLKHNMQDHDMKQEFEVATLKESLLGTFESKQKSYKRQLILSRKKVLN